MKIFKRNAIKCSPDFYDYYSIAFPLKALGRIQKNKYLCSELEKLHPCFSDDCCFDSRIRLSSHGLKAHVVVMQKFRLAEYKSQNHYKPIYIEEIKKIPFFTDDKIKKGMLIFAGLIALILLFTLVLTKQIESRSSRKMAAAPAALDYSNINENPHNTDPFSAIKTLLKTIGLNEGRVSDFSWKLNGFSQDCQLLLQNIFPEELLNTLPELTLSSVTYENMLPLMSAQFKGSLHSSVFMENEDIPVNEISSAFRSFLFKNSITIVEETVKPFSIKAKLPYELSAFKSLLEYLVDEEISASSFSINIGKDSILISIVFSERPIKNQNDFYECLLENSHIFFLQNEKASEDASIKKSPQKALLKTPPAKEKEIVIGKILRTDGSSVEFYKDENGRIKQR